MMQAELVPGLLISVGLVLILVALWVDLRDANGGMP